MSLSAGMTEFEATDPEFAERFAYFAGEEVPGEPTAELPARERYLSAARAQSSSASRWPRHSTPRP